MSGDGFLPLRHAQAPDSSGDLFGTAAAALSHPYIEPLMGNLYFLAVLAVFDFFCAPAKGRWFVVHSFANLITLVVCIPSVVAAVADPRNAADVTVHTDHSLFGDASPWPTRIIVSTHLYHMLAFRDLTAADIFHHLLFIPIIGLPGQFYDWATLANFTAFFISGLPGAMDYAMLGMIKHGVMKKITEKHYYSNISVWIRAPGLLFSSMLMYEGWLYGQMQCPGALSMPMALLITFNGLYYCKQAVANFAVHYMLDLMLGDPELRDRIRARLGGKSEMVMDGSRVVWDLSTPQRGS